MDSSIVIARLLGPFIVVIGAGLLFNTKTYLAIASDFFKNAALVYISGLITLVAGLGIVAFHNIWVADWRVIITLFGWIMLLKGIWLVTIPSTAMKLAKKFIKDINLALVPWGIMFIIGIFLMIKGYITG